MKFRVVIMESERGWGLRIDEVKMFETLEEAKAYRKKFNSHNDKPSAPDWYMYATQPEEVK